MKKIIFTLTMLLAISATAAAMSYEQARNQALFLADKMAYELNLTEDQSEAAYEINLDYLMGVNSYDDLYGPFWRQRNLDLSYVLLDWQYRAFQAASYFYRPLYWSNGFWHFAVYSRYPHRNYFYYGRPSFINVYVGGHSWRMNGGRSWYHGREWGRPAPGMPHGNNVHFGMRDGFKRGDYNRGFDFARSNRQQGFQPANSNFGGRRSTAPSNSNFGTRGTNPQPSGTVQRPSSSTRRNTSSVFGGQRQNNTNSNETRGNFGARQSSTRTTVRNFGGPSTESGSRTPANSFMPSRSSGSSSFGGSRSNGSATRSTSSFGGGSSSSRSSSMGGGSSSQRSGGAHFGGRR